MKLSKDSLKEMFTFLIVGGVATLVDWTAFYIFHTRSGFDWSFSVILSYTFGGATSYTMNKIFTFKDKSKDFALQISLFIIIMAGAYGLTYLFMYLQIEVLYKEIDLSTFFLSSAMLARVITTALVLIYNYIMHKFITFNKFIHKFIKDRFTPKSKE